MFHAVGHHPSAADRFAVAQVGQRGDVEGGEGAAFGATHGVGHQLVILVDVQDRSLGGDVPGELLECLLGQCDLVESGGQLS